MLKKKCRLAVPRTLNKRPYYHIAEPAGGLAIVIGPEHTARVRAKPSGDLGPDAYGPTAVSA